MSMRRIDRAVADYTALRPSLLPATDEFVEHVTGIIDDAGINYLSVTGRTKSIGSFAGKARAVLADDATADPLHAVTDQVGVRVITYVQRDIDAVAGLLAEKFTVLGDRDLGEETAAAGRFGYASRHLLVSRAAGEPTAYEPLFCASVQLRTVLQHRGRSSSTTSATRAPSRPSRCPTSTGGSPWPPVSRARGPRVRCDPGPAPGRARGPQRRPR